MHVYTFGCSEVKRTTTTGVSTSASFPIGTSLELSGFTVGSDGGGTWLVVDQRLRWLEKWEISGKIMGQLIGNLGNLLEIWEIYGKSLEIWEIYWKSGKSMGQLMGNLWLWELCGKFLSRIQKLYRTIHGKSRGRLMGNLWEKKHMTKY